MKNRTKFITTMLLTISLILTNLLPVYAEEITEDVFTEEAVLDSVDDAEAHLDWVDIEYPDKNYSGLPYPFSVVNDSEKALDWSFSELLDNDRTKTENTVLVTFTNAYNEKLVITSVNKDAKTLWIYNKGTVTASDNNPSHTITLAGYDGHGETYFVNRNLLNISDSDLNNIKLTEDGERDYIVVPGLVIDKYGYHEYYDEAGNIKKVTLNPLVNVIKDNVDPLNTGEEQTWIKITFLPNEEDVKEPEKEVPQYIKDGYKRELLNDNGDYIQVLSENSFNGKKLKPVISVSLDGQEYSTENKKLSVKYKNNKNAGTCTVTLKKIKKNKSATALIKGKTITFEILPITVSDNNLQTTVKNGTVKKVKVMTGGKYKKVSKKMWNLNGNILNFTGNYKGSVSLNNL